MVTLRASPRPVHGGRAHRLHPRQQRADRGFVKLARLLDVYAKRPQVQERLTTQVADTLEELMQPLGVVVVVEAKDCAEHARGEEGWRGDGHLCGTRHPSHERRREIRGHVT